LVNEWKWKGRIENVIFTIAGWNNSQTNNGFKLYGRSIFVVNLFKEKFPKIIQWRMTPTL